MQRPMQDIVILVSSIDAVESHHLDYVLPIAMLITNGLIFLLTNKT